jgi:CRISPR-associated exonuclease Cas4
VTAPTDTPVRVRALTDLGSTLLVEAAAGTGKTALIAGRITMLLAEGYAPRQIAAFTFMEAAASELSARVHGYIDKLLADQVPQPLKEALPMGLTSVQCVHLQAARERLEELTASTIHGFCQTLIHSYAVDANVDPGAQILDGVQAEVAFDTVFDRWLRNRLNSPARTTDPIVVLSKEDPTHVVSMVRDLARFRRNHREARPVVATFSGRPDIEFVEAVRSFAHWRASAPAEPMTEGLLESLETLAGFYQDAFQATTNFESLWRLAHPPRVSAMYADSSDLKSPKLKAAWQRAAYGDAGILFHDEAMALFTAAETCYRTLIGHIAAALVESLSSELDEVLSQYAEFKHQAAVLDFDDLLYKARDLVRGNEAVRIALGERYFRILVDEFQDTDPIQAEIFFRIAAIDCPEQWQDSTLRKGSLFIVGDPKQAIFRFRGADIAIYEKARSAIQRQHPQNILHITSSFRSMPDILNHVNACFERPFSHPTQPGYVHLTSTRTASPGQAPCVVLRTLDLLPSPRVNDVREAEAGEVAQICARLIGNLQIVDESGRQRLLEPADIALLAPTGTQLRIYEHALDEEGLPYASQAGKNLYERQEIQDLVSLARTLADPYDTLAFGALMRGPLVGMTEEELLDITADLPIDSRRLDAVPCFSILTDPTVVSHAVARETLRVLRELQRRSSSTTPMLLLSETIERLHVRALLAKRIKAHASRALANIDVFLELARGYDVRGLKHFARNVASDWAAQVPLAEGRVDATDDAIEIVTIHSSKGLEWPVVFLINTVTNFRPREAFVHRPADNTLHWLIGRVVPPTLRAALEADDESAARERERLLYVAFTRARDLLVLPKVPRLNDQSWTGVVSDPYRGLPELDINAFAIRPLPRRAEARNNQSASVFADQQSAIDKGFRHVHWVRPSNEDLDRVPTSKLVIGPTDEPVDLPEVVGAGRLRGLVLHKMMEEVLTGEISDSREDLTNRASELLSQLTVSSDPVAYALPQAAELGSKVAQILVAPEIAPLRHGLVPEVPVFATMHDSEAISVAGRADAVFFRDGGADVVIDWKSDVAPSTSDVESHAGQLRVYMRALKAARGALVYLSTGRVHWLNGR